MQSRAPGFSTSAARISPTVAAAREIVGFRSVLDEMQVFLAVREEVTLFAAHESRLGRKVVKLH